MRAETDVLQRFRRQRGAIEIIFVLLIVVLLGSVALVVDMGNLYRVRTELQTSADAAALAGAPYLDGTSAGLDAARAKAMEYAAKNAANGAPVQLENSDIVFGMWSATTREYTELGTAPVYPAQVNAIRIITQRTDERNNAVQMMFAGILGITQSDVSTASIAVGGGSAMAECPFPMAIADCSLEDVDQNGNCEYCMIFQNSNSDTAGWTSLGANAVGGPSLADSVVAACYHDDGTLAVDAATGECSGDSCSSMATASAVQVNNGNLLNTGNAACNSGDVQACNNPCPIVQNILTRGGTQAPQSFLARVPVMASDPGTCSADQYSGEKSVSGFAVIEIFGARCASGDAEVLDTDFPSYCPPPSSGDYVAAVLKCDAEPQGFSGGGFFGVAPSRYILVE